MNERTIYISGLLKKHLRSEMGEQEKKELAEWLNGSAANSRLWESIQHEAVNPDMVKNFYHYNEQRVTEKIALSIPEIVEPLQSVQIPARSAPRAIRKMWLRYAAVLILLPGTALYLWFKQPVKKVSVSATLKIHKNDVAPGRDGAILTLADGTNILLDTITGGQLADQNGTRIAVGNGVLSYKDSKSTEVTYNTMTTPKGRQFRIVLPDGTKVWLDAASSIRYPTSFIASQRTVEVTGQAYFEVEKNTHMPFQVRVDGGSSIDVLGTAFNVNAYRDEMSAKMTLLGGRIKVNAGSRSQLLDPGEEVRVNKNLDLQTVNSPDMERTMAWKNGYFQFRNASIQSVMREIARWYDIEVVYESAGAEELNGTIPRTVPLSDVLKILELTDKVHFRTEGKKVIIRK